MKKRAMIMAAACISLLLTFTAFAAGEVEGMMGGPGVRYNESGQLVALDGNTIRLDDLSDAPVKPYKEETKSPSASAGTAGGGTQALTEGGKTVYFFEGRKYRKKSSWGEHYLTGYCPQETGSNMTYSGKPGTVNHTVSASSQLPIGTVIIIEGVKGHDYNSWDGVYVVEDRGGTAVEKGLKTTNNTPVVDIFFDNLQDALNVTNEGFVTAHIYIAEEIL